MLESGKGEWSGNSATARQKGRERVGHSYINAPYPASKPIAVLDAEDYVRVIGT